MLNRLAQAFLVTFLIVAVPLQGYAAVSIGLCRALAHHDSDLVHAQAGPIHQTVHQTGGHESGHESVPHEHGAAGNPDSTAHCAACTACGASAAIAASDPVITPLAPEHAIDISAPTSPEGIVPEGIDRPPLTHFS